MLDLSGNRLRALPDDLPRLRALRILFCSGNPFEALPSPPHPASLSPWESCSWTPPPPMAKLYFERFSRLLPHAFDAPVNSTELDSPSSTRTCPDSCPRSVPV